MPTPAFEINHQLSNLVVGQCKDRLGCFLKLPLFVITDVTELAFGKAVDEKCLLALTVNHNAAIPLRLASTRAGDTLFDYATAQIGINQTSFCAFSVARGSRGCGVRRLTRRVSRI